MWLVLGRQLKVTKVQKDLALSGADVLLLWGLGGWTSVSKNRGGKKITRLLKSIIAGKHLHNSDQHTPTLEKPILLGKNLQQPITFLLPTATTCVCACLCLILCSDWPLPSPGSTALPPTPSSLSRCLCFHPCRLSNKSKTKRAYFCFSSMPAHPQKHGGRAWNA